MSKPHIHANHTQGWALVTGASSGLGTDFAKRLAERGYHLVLSARRESRLRSIATELEQQFNIQVAVIPCDLGLPGSALDLWQQASEARNITYLVNNAGKGDYADFKDVPLTSHQQTMQLNITSLVDLTHFAINHMKSHKKPSNIINIASIIAYQPVEKFAIYGATKAFVRSFSQSVSAELKGSNIQVTCVSPGGTKTEFSEVAKQHLEPAAARTLMTPDQVVTLGLKAADQKRWHTVTGFSNKGITFLPRLLPEKAATQIYSYIFGKLTSIAKS